MPPSPGKCGPGSAGAIADDDAWAVGSNGSKQLSEHWDGRRWEVVPVPLYNPHGHDPDDISPSLRAVSAVAADDVWATDYADMLHWDGAAWIATP